MARRNYIFSTIKRVFEKFGFQPIETPAMENIETLTGKYGDEGDQLLFKILNSRQYEAKNKEELLKEYRRSLENNINSPLLTEKALRYDLTVPFARYVVMHQNEIVFPFRRYQIQPVWRADRPQKGRYREFYQCDADVIGSNSLLNEVELVQMIDEAFTAMKIPVTIKINNRKILSGIAEIIGEKEKIVDLTVAIDKLEKVGIDGVNKELIEKGISPGAIEKLQPLLNFKGDTRQTLSLLNSLLSGSGIGKKGIEELSYIFKTISDGGLQTAEFILDLTLARGLHYYTGAIFEVKANNVQIGSICGGGRYDDLTGIFGLPNVSGVGISFGIDRIFDVMNELNLFTEDAEKQSATKVLFIHANETELASYIPVAARLRSNGINTEIYPDLVKDKKQFDYAVKRKIPFIVTTQPSGMQLKNMSSRESKIVNTQELINILK